MQEVSYTQTLCSLTSHNPLLSPDVHQQAHRDYDTTKLAIRSPPKPFCVTAGTAALTALPICRESVHAC